MDQQLESIRNEIRDLHDCLDGMREEQQELKHGISTYFLGVQPETHVRHHNALLDASVDGTDKTRIKRESIGIVIATLLSTLIINVFAVTYMTTNFAKQLNSPEHIEALKGDAQKK